MKSIRSFLAILVIIAVCAAGLPAHKAQAAEELMQEAVTEELAKPVVAKLKNTYSGIRVAWSESDGADGYYVYRKQTNVSNHKNDKDWEKIAETDAEVYIDDTVLNNTRSDTYKYEYKVQAVKADDSGEIILSPISERRAIYRLTRPGVVINKYGKTSIELYITGIKGSFDGTIVYRKGPGESSYTRVEKQPSSAYQDWDLIEGETYSYRICVYKSKSKSTVSKEIVITCGAK